jgi:Bacterial toxin 28
MAGAHGDVVMTYAAGDLHRRTLDQPDVDAADRAFQNQAVQAVRAGSDTVQRHADGDDRVLSSRIGYLGYPAPAPGQQQGGEILAIPPGPRGGTAEIFPRSDELDPRLEGGVGFPITPGGPEILINVPAPGGPTATDQGQRGLVTRITQLQRLLGDTRTTDAERPALEAELSEASRLLDRTEQFVPRPAPGDDT